MPVFFCGTMSETSRRRHRSGRGFPAGFCNSNLWERLLKAACPASAASPTFDATQYTSQIAGEVVEFNIEDFVPRPRRSPPHGPLHHYGMAASKLAVKDSGLDFTRDVDTNALRRASWAPASAACRS
jgi:3-oxoacyl-(acyl-carrier-protein) synthase